MADALLPYRTNDNRKQIEDEFEEDFMKEEKEAPEEVQEELIKDISSDETDVNVPELEPEDAMIHPPKNPGQSVFSNMEEMSLISSSWTSSGASCSSFMKSSSVSFFLFPLKISLIPFEIFS